MTARTVVYPATAPPCTKLKKIVILGYNDIAAAGWYLYVISFDYVVHITKFACFVLKNNIGCTILETAIPTD